jgi:GAF domain-containing protein
VSETAGASRDEEDLAEVFADLARQLTGPDPDEVLQRIVSAAVEVVEGCDHAGISLVLRNGTIDTPAASDDVAAKVDAIQYQTGQGPCLETIEDDRTYLIDDMATEDRWREFSRRAAGETAVASVLSFRLFTDEDTMGALNLYSREPRTFDERARAVGAVLAAHAAVALSNARDRERAEHLETALKTSREIGIAIGIVMARDRSTREQAFDQLRQASQHLNKKLRDVAGDVAQTGQPPGADQRE